MAGLDLGSAFRYVNQLQRPDLHLQHQPEPEDNEASNNGVGGGNEAVLRVPRTNQSLPSSSHESANTLRAHILEVGNGCDVFDCIANYARRRQRGICILSGNGTVTNVSIRQPAAAGAVADKDRLWEERGRELMTAGPVIVIASSFSNVAYERLPLEEDDQLQLQSSGGGNGDNNLFSDTAGRAGGLPFFNFPVNMQPNHAQLPVEGWAGNSGGVRPPF
ncbi:AT-hook motif nuclear-localized protein 21 [Hibiscus syriacus]|uniref:AT-hook motif nuclear-localized protein 21 n=1 Tax=Hibiscus syriacus TaxID=106335 RepID=A0A6A2ZP93_HIBSY|nr:AT-hook motif nuclear-localized protein 21 [Hibiscus syriacus]